MPTLNSALAEAKNTGATLPDALETVLRLMPDNGAEAAYRGIVNDSRYQKVFETFMDQKNIDAAVQIRNAAFDSNPLDWGGSPHPGDGDIATLLKILSPFTERRGVEKRDEIQDARECFAPASSCPACVSLVAHSAPPNGDELAWRALVEITDTNNRTTPPGQSAAGWRFRNTREELFPDPKHPVIPKSPIFSTYRDLACEAPALPKVFEELGKSAHFTLRPTDSDTDEFCERIFLNPAVATTVIGRGLYWREALLTYLFQPSTGQFKLPTDARESRPNGKLSNREIVGLNYFVAMDGTTRYALVALHLQSHQLQNSLWAKWIHADYLSRLENYPITDSFGCTGAAFPSTNLKTLLIEGKVPALKDLKRASCISCHAQAALLYQGHWNSPVVGVGQVVTLPSAFKGTDFDWTLARAPACQYGKGSECTQVAF